MAKIQDAKHFYAILVSLKTTRDILRHLDQLLATKYGKREMILNSIRLKSPEIHQAVAAYCSEGGGCFRTFADWATAGNHVPPEILKTASKGRDIISYAIVVEAHAKMKRKTRAAAGLSPESKTAKSQHCSKKAEELPAHSCRGKRKKKGSVWTISGGGANGIRNRR